MLFDQNKRRNLKFYRTKCAEGLGYQGIPAHQPIFLLMFREFYLKVVCSFFSFFRFFQLSSQHPYLEAFVGKPLVYTVDIWNKTEVIRTLKDVLKTQVRVLIGCPYSMINYSKL